MNNLTVLEQKTLNNISSVLSPNVKLGDKLQDIINNLPLLDTPVNASFSGGNPTTLTGGVNGTPGRAGQLAVDEDYLYVCLDTNTISDANWRRISIGDVY